MILTSVPAAPRAVLLLVLLTACGSTPPSRHYVLTPLAAAPEGDAAAPDLALAVGPVLLPSYLDRPQIVSDGGGNERALDELSRWAEPLDVGLARVLRENLARRLGSERVVAWPAAQAAEARFRVSVEVVRFEAAPAAGQAQLHARWTLFAGDVPVFVRRSELSQAVAGKTPGDAVAALSRLLADLSAEVAEQIRELMTQPHGS